LFAILSTVSHLGETVWNIETAFRRFYTFLWIVTYLNLTVKYLRLPNV